MTTIHTIYHTPASSLYNTDPFIIALFSLIFTTHPTAPPPPLVEGNRVPIDTARLCRVPSTLSMTPAHTTTPSLFVRGVDVTAVTMPTSSNTGAHSKTKLG
ncbi:uncharacterized protein BXZ73DRAFT_107753 [Epithele typhae]|uniref:uncharacterized protein n=1 Tax=Epithele typhae TaxID=378194 RepID=UPI002007F72D|nr:uncharacterized protein BXZ73DRAFT_107753 [Epithele typhae]KAH9911921.1 hypothetical protein BXZ73DRAFT_107753 [Epithele typhae]